MTTDLEELRKLAEAIGAEQWGYVQDDDTSTVLIVRAPNDAIVAETDDAERAKFIAAANPAAFLALVSELEALREAVKPFAEAIERYTAHWNDQTGSQSLEDDDEKVEFMGWLGDYFPLVTLGDFRRALASLTKENPHV